MHVVVRDKESKSDYFRLNLSSTDIKLPFFRIILTKRNFIEYLWQLLPSETFHESMVGGKKIVIPPKFSILQ